MFSKILSIFLCCISLNQSHSPFKVETPSLDNTQIIKKAIEPINKISKPTIQILNNTYQQYEIKILNNNNYNVVAVIDGTDGEYEPNIQENSYFTITENWEDATTRTITAYFTKPGYTNSDTETITINRPTQTKISKPTIQILNNTYQQYEIKILNNNNYNVVANIEGTDGEYEPNIQANSYFTITENWEDASSRTITAYFTKPGYTNSDTETITINSPTQTKISKPTIQILNNTYQQYEIKILNNNNYNVVANIEGTDGEYQPNIQANSYFTITENWEDASSRTITAYFTKPGYTNSDIVTITINRPEQHILTGGYTHYEYDAATFTYTITISNTNNIAINYTDNLNNKVTIQPNQSTNIDVKLTTNQDALVINGTLEPAVESDYQNKSIQFRLDNIAYIEVNSITRQKNGDITIKYQYAQPLNNNWNLEITDNIDYNETINLNLVNTKDTITLKNQPNTKLYFNFKYKNEIVTTENIPETQKNNTTEVIDIPGLMLLILTLPFSFLSQAFNLTLFPGTQYAFNVADIILTVVGAIIIFYIIKLIIKMIKLL